MDNIYLLSLCSSTYNLTFSKAFAWTVLATSTKSFLSLTICLKIILCTIEEKHFQFFSTECFIIYESFIIFLITKNLRLIEMGLNHTCL